MADNIPHEVSEESGSSLPPYSETDESNAVGEQDLYHQPDQQLEPSYVPRPVVELGDDYTTGLFQCHDSVPICLYSTFLPCYSWGTVRTVLESGAAEIGEHDEGQEADFKTALKAGLPYLGAYIVQVASNTMNLPVPSLCLAGLYLRRQLKKKYGMKSTPVKDSLSHAFCHCCALAQDHREMLYRERAIRDGYVLSQQQNEDIV